MSYSRLNRPATQSLITTRAETPQDVAARAIRHQMEEADTVASAPPKERVAFLVGHSRGYLNWTQYTRITNDMREADFVFWTGGEDIGTHWYSEYTHPTTSATCDRDTEEVAAFKQAQLLGKPCFGTCRGIQFLAAMAGAKLVQHQANPHFMHDIETHDGRILTMSSCHHQGVWPWSMNPSDYQVLAWAHERQSDYHEDGLEQEMITGVENEKLTQGREVEAILFPKIRAYGVQGHLEMIYGRRGVSETIRYYQAQFTRFLASGGTSVDTPVVAAPAAVTA